MTKTQLTFFWVLWLLDVLVALYGYREFIQGVFGQYSAPTSKYILLWVVLLAVALGILVSSVYFKNHGSNTMAFSVAAAPLVLALPYIFWLVVVLLTGKNARWN